MKLVKIVIGLLLLTVGSLGLVSYIDPEMPIRMAFNFRSAGDPVGTVSRVWFDFVDSLQTMNTIEYGGYALLLFGLAVTGFLTVWKALRQK